jgi:dTDP-glucose 4,6-dehydratase
MRVLVTGGAGFVGSNLCEFLLDRGDTVVCVDNLSTGRLENIDGFLLHPRFTFFNADVVEGIGLDGPVHAIAHLASPASPPDYHRLPLETLAVGSRGTENVLKLARAKGARFVLASTSEVYGDPQIHPQVEEYWGNVNPIGPRSVYDEAKRYAEAVSFAYLRHHDVNVGVVRIFNTYGPRMRANDGRVVSTFVVQALCEQPMTIYGDGTQTRSFCYVDDLVRGLAAMLDSDEVGPVNLGNPNEFTVAELATLVIEHTGTTSTIDLQPLPIDDPTRRRPDISRAETRLGWRPQVALVDGLRRTIAWFANRPAEIADAAVLLTGPQFQGAPAPAVLRSA